MSEQATDEPPCPFNCIMGDNARVRFGDQPLEDFTKDRGIILDTDLKIDPFALFVLLSMAWREGYKAGRAAS